MDPDINSVDEARGLALLLHPHPHLGGDRFHPFIDALFSRLPQIGINAIRFDFSSAELFVARREAVTAIDEGAARWPRLPVMLAGYSFGAGVAAGISDERIAGWYLLAPPAPMLTDADIGRDPRPKAVVVPEHDQFSPPATIAQVVAEWAETAVTTVPDADHFLGALQPIVEGSLLWIARNIDPERAPSA
jgi:alpha/beta superfamily hydrolase